MLNARRGEVWLVDLGMAAKARPAVILSVPFRDDERALFAFPTPRLGEADGLRLLSMCPSFNKAHLTSKVSAIFLLQFSSENWAH